MLKKPNYIYSEVHNIMPCHMHFGKTLLDCIKAEGERYALINADTGEVRTHAYVAQRAVNISLSISRHGIGKGHLIGIMSEKRFDFMPTFLGVICAGATHTQVDIESGPALIRHRFNTSNPSAIFCSKYAFHKHRQALLSIKSIKHIIVYDDEALVKKEQEGVEHKSVKFHNFEDFVSEHADVEQFIPVDVTEDDICVLLYSSGTTGLPKPIPLTHKIMNCTGLPDPSRHNKGKRALITRQWYNTYGLMTAILFLKNGGTIVFTLNDNSDNFLRIIDKYKVDIITVSPIDLAAWAKSPVVDECNLTSLQMISSGSMPLNTTVEKLINERIPTRYGICQLYAMSEGPCPTQSEGAYKGTKLGSVGPINVGHVIKVVDLETREALGPNQKGEICVKGPTLFRGYMGLDNTGVFDDEGFYLTGDLGYYDDDGYFFVIERLKELLKCNSYAVAPAELEAVLMAYDGVEAAGVVGAPHPEFGQVPVAFVQLQKGAKVTAEELLAYSDKELTKYRIAGGIHFIDKMPLNAGKLNRRALRELLEKL